MSVSALDIQQSATAPMVQLMIRSIQMVFIISLQSDAGKSAVSIYLRDGQTQGGIIHGCCWRKSRHRRRTVTFGTGGTSHCGETEKILESHGGISHGAQSRKRRELMQARSKVSLRAR